MKQITNLLLSISFFMLLISCGGGDAAKAAPETPAVKALNCADLTSQYDEQEGKEITIKAISWGTSNTTTGDIHLGLGDEVLSGLKQSKIVVVFPADREAEAKGIAKDAELTIKATVGESKYGAIYLTNPAIQ